MFFLQKNNFVDFKQYDKLFHELFIHLTNNSFLKESFEKLYFSILRMENLYYTSPQKMLNSFSEHTSITNALKNRDLDLAILEMRKECNSQAFCS